jgi:hypothetical protein
MKAKIPETIPVSIVSDKAGLATISAKIVSPAGTDLYNEFVNDVPMINNSGIAMINPTDHLPNIDIGLILQGCFAILFSFHNGPAGAFEQKHTIFLWWVTPADTVKR